MIDAFKTNGSSPPTSTPRRFSGFLPGQALLCAADAEPTDVQLAPSDVELFNHGSVYLLQPLTDAGVEWINDNLPPDCLRWGADVVIEPRYVAAIIHGILDDGLEVR